jgi:cytochrome c-type biogenesis protein CcmH/NrfF
MKTGFATALISLVLGVVPLCAEEAVSNMGNVRGGDTTQAAHGIIEKKCTTCHSDKLIDSAFTAKKDMAKIQLDMEKKGAKLNSKEQEVLGIYWKSQNPLKQAK